MFSIFIILLVRNRPEVFSHPKPNRNFKVSVIIPVHNEEDSVEETVNHIMDLDYPEKKKEVIVVNNNSTDKTGEILKKLKKKYRNLKVVFEETPGKSNAVNAGIKIATGELMAVSDADSFPSEKSLEKLTGFFDDPKMGAVTSFVTIRNKEDNFLAKIQSIEYMLLGWNRKMLDFVDSVYVTNGPLSLYRKKFVEEAGGFDPKSITEDIDITWNLMSRGYKTGICLDARVSTIAPTKFKMWFRQRTRWGMGGLQALMKYKKMFFRKGMFGIFVMPFVSFSIIMSLFTFSFSMYLLLKLLFTKFLSTGYSVTVDTALFNLQEVNFYPSALIFYFVVLFGISFVYTWYVLKITKYEENLTIKKFFNVIFYMLIYLTVYPIVWFASIYRYATGDMKWW
tara:strand:+ start:2082 stop:3266 length:1185 start_codon:yes stop_codon:yes gene_type:complete